MTPKLFLCSRNKQLRWNTYHRCACILTFHQTILLPHLHHLHSAPAGLNFSQLTTVCGELDRIWMDSLENVLYSWQQFLANEVIPLLGVTTELILEPQKLHQLSFIDRRAHQEVEDPFLVIARLTDFDRKKAESRFRDKRFCCEICLQSVLGAKCEKLHPCDHVHCADCLTAHITWKIESGDVTHIDCPTADCDKLIPQSIVQRLVSAEVFSRYERILRQRTLETRKDIVFCPRPKCHSATPKDENSNLAVCPECTLAFCLNCRKTWHGVAPCKALPSELKKLKEVYDKSSLEDKRFMEKEYGRDYLIRAFQEIESRDWIAGNSKECPSCHSHIQKIDGCNKMYCTHCQFHFCWLCEQVINHIDPYYHYSPGVSSCSGKLFQGMTGLEFDEYEQWI